MEDISQDIVGARDAARLCVVASGTTVTIGAHRRE